MSRFSRLILISLFLAFCLGRPAHGEDFKLRLSVGSDRWGLSGELHVSTDGRWVLFATKDDLDGQGDQEDRDWYLADTESGTVAAVTRDAFVAPHALDDCGNAVFSGDGRMVYFFCSRTRIFERPEVDQQPVLFALDRDPDRNGTMDEQSPPAVTMLVQTFLGNTRFLNTNSDGSRLLLSPPGAALAPCLTISGELVVIDRDGDGDGTWDEPGDRLAHCTGVPYSWDGLWFSGDGRYLLVVTELPLVASDTNGQRDAYRVSAQDGTAVLVQPGPDGAAIGGATPVDISHDGRFVLFTHDDSTLDPTTAPTTVFRAKNYIRDFETSTTRAVGIEPGVAGYRGNGWAKSFDLTPDGRYVSIGRNSYEDTVQRGRVTSFRYTPELVEQAVLAGDASKLIVALKSTTPGPQLYLFYGEPQITIEPSADNPVVATVPHGQVRPRFDIRNRGGKSAHEFVFKIYGAENSVVRAPWHPLCELGQGEMTCPSGMEAGGLQTVTAEMLASGLGDMTVRAELVSLEGQAPAEPVAAEHTIDVLPGINPTVFVEFVNPVYRGRTTTVQVIVRNQGVPGALTNQPTFTATNAVLTIELPEELTLNFANLFTTMNGGCSLAGRTITCRDSGIALTDNRVVRFPVVPQRTGSINYTGTFRADQRFYGGALDRPISGVFSVLEEPPPAPEEPPKEDKEGGGGPLDPWLALLAASFAIRRKVTGASRSTSSAATARP
jgi:hypothetical protein